MSLLASDGVQLKAWWFVPHTALFTGGCVVILHGIADSKQSSAGFASLFTDAGYAVLTPDNRAHGESGGQYVTYGLLERYDVIRWAHLLQEKGCRRVYGLGESLGGAVLIQASAVEPIFRAIVAECPYADLRFMAVYRTERMLGGPRFVRNALAELVVESGLDYALLVEGLNFRRANPKDSLKTSRTPLLLIHGAEDTRTPTEQSRLLCAARPGATRLWLVPHAQHTDASVAAPAEFRSSVLLWFAKH